MTKNIIISRAIIFLLLAVIIKLLVHSSENPFILHLYSLSYFIQLLVVIPVLLWMIFVLFRYELGGARTLLKKVIIVLAVLIFIEAAGQFYAWMNPSYSNLLLFPSEKLGWTYPPGMEFKHTSKYWYAREFSSVNKINSLGFRDLERSFNKEKNVVRVALFGASIVSGKESGFKDTVGQKLQRKLNAQVGPNLGKKFEVLSFGVMGHGMSQALITYYEIARKFDPDFLILYIKDELHIWKNTNSKVCWPVSFLMGEEISDDIENSCFLIRPVLWFEDKEETFSELYKLIYLKEFNEFVAKLDNYKDSKEDKYLEFVENYELLIKKIPNFIKSENLEKIAALIKSKNIRFIPPQDIKKFSDVREKIKEKIFKQKNIRKIKPQVFIRSFYKDIKLNIDSYQEKLQTREYEEEFYDLRFKYLPKSSKRPLLGNDDYIGFELAILLALKVLQNFDEVAKGEGQKFAIVNALKFHNSRNSELAAGIVSDIFQKFSSFIFL